MATSFVLHPLAKEKATEPLVAWPTWGYTAWTYALVVSRRSGTSPTLDLDVQTAPVPNDDDLYETLDSFTQVTDATALPHEESLTATGETPDFTMGSDARYHRVNQTVGGTGAEWWYLVTATVELFDPATAAHLELLEPRFQGYSDLADLASQAEDDVVRRWTVRGRRSLQTDRRFRHQTVTDPWQHAGILTVEGVLELYSDEDTGRALREAIARRIDWRLRRKELETSTKPSDGPLLRRHLAREWEGETEALRGHDARTPLYAL